MVYIGQLGSQRASLALCDYLKMNKLEFHLEEKVDSGLVVFTLYSSESDATKIQTIFDSFVADPNQDKFRQASWQVTEPTFKSTNQSWGLTTIWSSVGWLTRYTATLCAVIFLLSYLGWYREIFFALKFEWTYTEIYRFFTPAIMHLSALHILFNLAWWWYLGGKVEEYLGVKTLLIVFVVSAIFSNTFQAAVVNDQFAGLSGVNYALASFVWVCGAIHKSTRVYLPNNLFIFLIVWMLIGFADVLPIPMANWAHLGGFVAGLILAMIMVKKKGA